MNKPALDEPCEECGRVHQTSQGNSGCLGHRWHVEPLTPCGKNPMTGSRYCRTHGGTRARGSANGNYKTGKHCKTRYAHMPADFAEGVERKRAMADLMSCEDGVAVTEQRIDQLFQRLDKGEGSGEKTVVDLIADLRDLMAGGKAMEAQAKFVELEAAASADAARKGLWREIQDTMKTGARLRDTHARQIQAARSYVTREEFDILVSQVVAINKQASRESMTECMRLGFEALETGEPPTPELIERLVGEVFNRVMVTGLSLKLGATVPAVGVN